ncbi:glycosyltransferase [Sphingomonas oligoaromativorans]|uniref:glycosyltransferase n=1 Tax=Sphingomonas oligoaromativorans TaxID=575322 RepID=UPI00141FD033|nr:glycosyltransferase [Sphingomonas oligoaromativorans]NIJ33736.1 glycosyltransferase involved in cell wall biosynthesis [Sphingomonas oligoaromativorans]
MRDERPILLVSPLDETMIRGGRDMVSAMNLAILTDLHGDRLLRYRLSAAKVRRQPALLHGHIDGIDDHSIAAIDRIVGERNMGQVFLDGSNLGGLARAIRRRRPGVRIITFCHNVETSFFFGALRSHRTPKAAAVLLANALAERSAVRSSDILFCLSERDGRIMRRLHGRMPDAVLPLAIADSYREEEEISADMPKERYALFVGGGFYANIDGIRWYLRKVAPQAGLKTVIVGRGMERLRDLCRERDACLVGQVADLAPWYRAAHVVIAPILGGSGMKTKVAEALMHGKRVIGTAEAFSGYGPAVLASGDLCRDAGSFAQAIRHAATLDLPAFDPALRALYERFHSFTSARERMADALASSR